MEEVTTHEAKTHLSSLIERVLQGEEIVICRGKERLVRLVRVDQEKGLVKRPAVGTVTSGPVSWTADAFDPLTEDELRDWGI